MLFSLSVATFVPLMGGREHYYNWSRHFRAPDWGHYYNSGRDFRAPDGAPLALLQFGSRGNHLKKKKTKISNGATLLFFKCNKFDLIVHTTEFEAD